MICKSKNIGRKIFNDFDTVFSFFRKIRDGNRTLEKVKKRQNEYKSDLNELKRSKN